MKRITPILLILLLLFTACASQASQSKETEYAQAQTLYDQGNYAEATRIFTALAEYKDSKYMLSEIRTAQEYEVAMSFLAAKDYPQAFAALCALGDYKDVPQQLERFQVIEITLDNWQEYFEIITETKFDITSTGEYESVNFYHYFQMKEDAYSRIFDLSRNTVNAACSYHETLKNVSLDRNTGAYSLENDESYYVNLGHHRACQVSIKEADRSVELGRALHTQGNDGIGVPFSFVDEWTNITLTDINGYLYLYE